LCILFSAVVKLLSLVKTSYTIDNRVDDFLQSNAETLQNLTKIIKYIYKSSRMYDMVLPINF